MLAPPRIDQVARDHRIEAESVQRDASSTEHEDVLLQVVSDLLDRGVGQELGQGAHLLREDVREVADFRHVQQLTIGWAVEEGEIVGVVWLDGDRESDESGARWVKVGGLRVEGKASSLTDYADEIRDLLGLEERLVVDLAGGGFGRLGSAVVADQG